MRSRIGILGWGSISPLGSQPTDIWQEYEHNKTNLSKREELDAWIGSLFAKELAEINLLREIGKPYTKLDRTVLLAIIAAEKAMKSVTRGAPGRWGVIIGSSRGAT